MKRQYITMAAVAAFTAVLVIGGVLVGMNLTGNNPTPTIDAESVVAAFAEILPPEIPQTIAIPGYAQLVMIAGNLIQHVELHNPAGNPCYFVISIILPDGTEVFRSGLVPPGQRIDAIRLTHVLEVGTYNDTIMRYFCYSTTDKTPMNGADTKFTLEVVQ